MDDDTGAGTGVDDAVAALRGAPGTLPDTVAGLPAAPGLYAWWAPPAVLPDVGGDAHPAVPGLRCLDVGTATMLRNRVTRQHLYRSGVSELRRALAGMLLDELGLAPTWAADVILTKADEERLTAWMREHLLLTWCARDDREALRDAVATALGPGLDATTVAPALERYTAAAGEKTVTVVGVPFRRP